MVVAATPAFNRRLLAAVLVLAAIVLSGLWSATARAAGSPDIGATVSSSQTLLGDPVHVRVTASNPLGQPYGYNLTYRVVLPQGVTYAGGGPVAPRQIADAPNSGETTLIFENVSDLSPGATGESSFDLQYSSALYDAGDSFPVGVQAFVNEDPRYIPKFDAKGIPAGPEATSFTGYTPEIAGVQTLKAIDVDVSEPSPEGEILRGVHEHQTVYTLTVTNNAVNPTTGTKLDAYVPAGLEFLGCGGPGADNTTEAPTNPGSAEEYAGSGPIQVEPLPGCVAPESVETELVDPDGPAGPMPEAVYTHVVFPVGELKDGETKTFPYRAAVPLRANVNSFPGARPGAASGGQATNLDNNSGPEVTDETPLRTYATAAGTYQGKTPSPATDSEQLDRSAEDWVVHKSASSGTLAQGQITTWTLRFETSEYKFVDGATVTDTLPNGLCPLGPENFTGENDGADGECDPVAGQEPSAPYASAEENADGTWTLSWDEASLAKLGHTGISDDFTITFPTRTRTHYQENFLPATSILTHDRVDNTVTTSGSGLARCTAPGTPDCSTPGPKIYGSDGPAIGDFSHAEQEAGAPVITKEIAESGADCQTAAYTTGVPHYRPGDEVCWRLRIDFPGTLDTSPQALADYLPEGSEYVAGSDEAGPENNVTATADESGADEGLLTWTVTGSTVPAGGEVFEHFITTVAKPSGIVQSGDLTGNLFKFSSENTAEETFPQRAEAEYVLDAPELALVKGVNRVNGQPPAGNLPNTDGVTVHEGDFVEYRIDVSNNGSASTQNVEVRDLLEDGITCAEVKVVSHAGGCTGGQVDWFLPQTIAPGAIETFFYAVEIPSGVEPGKRIDDRAGVVSYQTETNTGEFFTYVPANNINPGAPTPNAPAADDDSWVHTPAASFTKTAVTGVTEAGNNLATQATIGEQITYASKFTLPAGTTLYGGEFSDLLPAGRYEFISGGATLNGGPLPGPSSVNLNPAGGMEAFLPASYTNPVGSGDDVFEFTLVARVADVAANSRVAPKQTLTNTAHFNWESEDGTPHAEVASVSTETVEPNMVAGKSDDDPDNRVSPGQVVQYTVGATNANGTRVSTAHEVTIVDHVPVGLIPVGLAPGNEPLADGAEVPGSGGALWDAGTRTIIKEVGSLAPGAGSSFSYRAEVEKPAVAGSSLTNEVEATTASLDEGTPNRRIAGSGYEDTAEDTIRLAGASVVKSVTPEEATPGDPLTYKLKVSIPANVELFDTTVVDVLPASLELDGSSVTCLSGCPLANQVNFYGTALQADGTEKLAWDLGDIPALSQPQEIEVVYNAHLRETNRTVGGQVLAGDTEVNTATVNSNLTDKTGPFDPSEIPDEFDETSEVAESTVEVVEPQVTLDKLIKVGNGVFGDGPVIAHSNEPPAYELVVENTGTSPAYDVEVTDALDPALTNVQVVPQAGVTVTEPWSAATNSMKLVIAGPIAPGARATVEYTAEFVAAAQLSDGETVPNTAAIPLYFGVSEADREANPSWEFREYSDGSDTVQAVLDFPTLEIEKTTGLGGNPETGTAEVGQEFPWRIVVSNSSATADAKNVTVADLLPPNWKFVEGSAEFNGSGAPDPAVTAIGSADELQWAVPTLAHGASVTISFDARPQLAAKVDPGTAPEANVNEAEVISAEDEAGNTGNAEGEYVAGPDDATATLAVPQLKVEKTPDGGGATAGSPSSFTIEVDNEGDGVARNVKVKDLLPSGLSYEAGTATAQPEAGFSETGVNPGPGAGQTTIEWGIASIPAHSSVQIELPVKVAQNVADGTTLTNTASATSDEETTPVSDTGSLDVGAEADMAIEKSGAASYTAGTEYTWHLRVRNLGPSDAQNVVVKDPLPAGTSLSSIPVGSPCIGANGEVSCALATVPAGFDQTYSFTVDVAPDTATSPLDNTATVETSTEDPEPANDASTFGPTASPLADVSVVKTASPEAILRKHETTFTLTVHNAGPSVAREVELEDPLPVGLEFVSADEPPCTQAGGTVDCAFGDLPPGGEATVHVTAKGIVNGVHVNTATVSTPTPEPQGGGNPNSDSAEVEVGPVADLALEKTAPPTVAADGQLTWTLKVTNNGEDPATEVEITDPLPAGTVFAAADSGCTLASGIVTCGVGNLAVSESAERHITVTVPRALADTTVVNSATVKGKEGDDEPANDSDTAETKVGPSADVAIVKTGPARVNADGSIAWTLAVSNNGPSTATGVTVEDALPAGVELSSATPTQGSCAGAVECRLGTLPKGGGAQIQVVAHVPPALEGQTLANKTTVTAEEPDPVPGNNESEAKTIVDPPAPSDYDLSITKTVDGSATPNLGDTVSYELAVKNRGPATANGLKIVDTLPGGLEYVKATIPGGKCGIKGAAVTCQIPSLAAGAEVRARVTARVMQVGTIKNTASVSAAVADADPGNDSSTAKIRSTLGETKLRVKKTRIGHGVVEPGEAVKFKIRVTNSGDSVAANVSVCDRLPAAMSFASLRGAKLANGEACWELDLLPAGASKTFRLAARVDGGVNGGTVRNVAYVKADNAPKRSGVAAVHVESAGPGRAGGVTG